jgi:hypothetical protein
MATFASSFTSIGEKSRPSRIGTLRAVKYPGDTAFMKACMSSPSAGLCPSTDVVLSHSSPLRMGTVASPAACTPGAPRSRSSSDAYSCVARSSS